jgi:hypothetical protein
MCARFSMTIRTQRQAKCAWKNENSNKSFVGKRINSWLCTGEEAEQEGAQSDEVYHDVACLHPSHLPQQQQLVHRNTESPALKRVSALQMLVAHPIHLMTKNSCTGRKPRRGLCGRARGGRKSPGVDGRGETYRHNESLTCGAGCFDSGL